MIIFASIILIIICSFSRSHYLIMLDHGRLRLPPSHAPLQVSTLLDRLVGEHRVVEAYSLLLLTCDQVMAEVCFLNDKR